jgi:hypothetical protein
MGSRTQGFKTDLLSPQAPHGSIQVSRDAHPMGCLRGWRHPTPTAPRSRARSPSSASPGWIQRLACVRGRIQGG